MSIKRKGWKYKNLAIVFLSFVFAYFLSRDKIFIAFLQHLGNFGYPGAIIAGMLFVSTFTVATGAVILFTLANYLNPFEIAVLAGIGGVIGDYIIFKLIKDNLQEELTDIYNNHFEGKKVSRLFHTKYFNWMLPVIGALIIASPLPDEVGVSLLGISKMKTLHFMLVSFILNSIGIFLIVTSTLIL